MKSLIVCFTACAVLSLVGCGSSSATGEASDTSEVNAKPEADQRGQGANDVLRAQYDRFLRGDNSPEKSPGGHWRVVSYSTSTHRLSPAEAGAQHIVFTHMSEGGGEASMVTRFYDGDPRMSDVGNGYESRGTFKLSINIGEGEAPFAPVLSLDETRTSPSGPINVKTTYVIASPETGPTGPATAGDKLTLRLADVSHDQVTLELVRDGAPTYCQGFAGPHQPDPYCAAQMVSISVPNTVWCPMSHACVAHQCEPGCIQD